MKIFVATYRSPNNTPYQKVFKSRKEAIKWLKQQHSRDFEAGEASFKEWSEYGAWSAKVIAHTI
jgi:hypothetical protein